MKKSKIIAFMLLVTVFLLSLTSFSSAKTQIDYWDKVNSDKVSLMINDRSYDFTINKSALGNVSYKELYDLAQKHLEGKNFVIYESSEVYPKVKTKQNISLASEQYKHDDPMVMDRWVWPVIYSDKTYTGYDMNAKTDFITSVPKGGSFSFTSTTIFGLNCSISGSCSPFELGISPSVSRSFTSEYNFNGPPEDKPNVNCRVYEIDFYEDGGWYHCYCLNEAENPPRLLWEEYGIFYEPSRYYFYSYDVWIEP